MSDLRLAAELFFCILLLIPSFILVTYFNFIQHEPYMDEIFHVRQTAAYLAHNWTQWDSKITTPPGLYAVGYIFVKPILTFFPSISLLYTLRYLNVFLVLVIYVTLSRIINDLTPHGQVSLLKSALSAFNCLCLPLIYFFNIFYYTDHCSLLFYLFGLQASLNHSNLSFIPCLIAVFCRQTNIVWNNFILGILVIQQLGFEPVRRFSLPSYISTLYRDVLAKPLTLVKAVLNAMWANNCQITLVNIFFACFLLINRGVVLGDKESHTAAFHVPQLFYFWCFCAFFTPSSFFLFCFHSTKTFFRYLGRRKFRTLFLLLLFSAVCMSFMALAVKYFTYEHPYLLADNRHYTSVIWRKLIKRHDQVKYYLVPVYFLTLIYYFDCMISVRRRFTFQEGSTSFGHFVCTCVALIPAPLVEFRYFVVPFIVWRLLSYNSTQYRYDFIIFDIIWYTLINSLTFYALFMLPFEFPHEPGIMQRFMW